MTQDLTTRFPQTFLFAALIFIAGCAPKAPRYEKVQGGIVVSVGGDQAKKVRLSVVSDDIIRVSATPTGEFSSKNSLMIVPQEHKPQFKVEESSGAVSVVTSSLKATVSLETGEVSFFDQNGNAILKEKQGGGKQFAPSTVEGSYTIRQVFESPEDEAFYGLGGHQNGQMNYKGDDVELVQHNIVDVVPFL